MSQRGWLTKQKRKKDGRVWIFHWYRVRPSDGKHVENTVVVGRVASFPKESNAWEEVERRSLNHNINEPDFQTGCVTFGELARSYDECRLACFSSAMGNSGEPFLQPRIVQP